MGDLAFLLHYRQGYKLYSSLEHADVMALSGYIRDENESEILITSGIKDDYISIVLTHNFCVMADLLVAVMNYFGIQRPDIREKLLATWKGLDRDRIEGQ